MRRKFTVIISLAILVIVPLTAGHAASAPVLTSPDPKPAVQTLEVKNETAAPPVADKPLKNEITAVRWANHIDAVTGQKKLRMVLDLTGPVKLETEILAMPVPQLAVNITGASPGKVADSYDFDGRIVDLLTINADGPASTRLVLQLPLMIEANDYKVFTLPSDAINKKPHRVVIDLNQKVPPVKYSFTAGLKNKTIAIDPGHGGSDPGAVGLNNTREKTITLAIAQQLRSLLEQSGAKVIMTRKDDRDVFGVNAAAADELKARSTIANNNKADVFVSIHIDAFTNRTAGGTTSYYYQKTPYDALLANSIQSFIAPAGGLQDRGAAAANFYVIKRTVMPAVLTEIAFISNPAEEKLLNTPEFQQKIAQGIYRGLDKFFAQAAKLGGR